MKCLYTRNKSSHTHTWEDDDVNQCDIDTNETVWNLPLYPASDWIQKNYKTWNVN